MLGIPEILWLLLGMRRTLVFAGISFLEHFENPIMSAIYS